MSRYLMRLSYDGTGFHGWQIQKQNRTVQLVLEQAFKDFCGEVTKVTGSGRTDTGVHALAQSAHFDYAGTATPEQMRKGLRRFLPDDIQILSITPVHPEFHARYDAYQRYYQYVITKNETPFNRLYQASFTRKKLRYDLMRQAAAHFIGEHDFTSFSRENPAVPDHVCTIITSEFTEHDDRYVYHICADRFLHNMVRRIVGSIVNIGHLQLEPAIVLDWLKQKESKQTIIYPAPAQGLYLVEVLYPDDKLNQNRSERE
jgi:tRNA pseudouridine38-40 synthase